MMDDTNIADGIALTLLLAGLVLASAVVGASGLVPVASQAHADERGDDATVTGGSTLLSLDGKGNDPFPAAYSHDVVRAAFPINNISFAGGSTAPVLLFPINNFTFGSASTAPHLLFPINNISVGGSHWTLTAHVPVGQDMDPYAVPGTARWQALGQDMDPYAVPWAPDPLPQDMDPY